MGISQYSGEGCSNDEEGSEREHDFCFCFEERSRSDLRKRPPGLITLMELGREIWSTALRWWTGQKEMRWKNVVVGGKEKKFAKCALDQLQNSEARGNFFVVKEGIL